jgi:hypothetical protein
MSIEVNHYVTRGENRTHYASEDIDAVLHAMQRLVACYPRVWTYEHRERGPETIGVRYRRVTGSTSPSRSEEPGYVYWVPYEKQQEHLGILKKKEMDEMEPDLVRLVSALEDNPVLPTNAVVQIGAVGAYMLGVRLVKRGAIMARLLEAARRAVEEQGLTVRVLPKVVDPLDKPRLTPAQKAAHWEERYRTGRWAKRMSWRKEHELMPALRRYAEGWRATLPWLDKARELGADPELHKTPSELLRELADLWDEEERF